MDERCKELYNLPSNLGILNSDTSRLYKTDRERKSY
jgi:hypothetical protein